MRKEEEEKRKKRVEKDKVEGKEKLPLLRSLDRWNDIIVPLKRARY